MNSAIYQPNAELGTSGGDGLNTNAGMIGSIGTSYPAYVKEPELYARAAAFSECSLPEQIQAPIAGLDLEVAEALCTGRRDPGAVNDFGNMEELDDAGASVSFAPVQAKEIGCWNYVSTRNNNFSNRSQKGTICVNEGDYADGDVSPSGGDVVADIGWISIPTGAITNIQTFSMQSAPREGAASEEVWIEPVEMDLSAEQPKVQLAVSYEQRAFSSPKLVHRTGQTG